MSTFTRFNIDYNEESCIDEQFRSKKIKYNYRNLIYDDSYMSDVYNFCKKDIKCFKNFYKNEKLNGIPISISSYDLYVVYENEEDEDETIVTKHIYYLQVDKYGTKLKEEKMFLEEDYNIPTAYEIYILIELYSVPPSLEPTPQKEIHDVLKPVFELCGEEERDIYEPIPNKIIRYKSKTIETGNNTPYEIFTQTLPHLISFQCLYKNDRIGDTPASTTTYTVEVVGDELHRVLYHGEIDKNGVTTRESKPYEVISELINASYEIHIVIGIYCHPEEQAVNQLDEEAINERVNQLVEEALDERVHQLIEEAVEERINQLAQNAVNERTRWLEEQARESVTLLEVRARRLREEIERLERPRAEDLQINIRSTREDICCVCLTKPPNVMFSNCGHLCLCEECNDRLNSNHNFEVGNLKCPMCRTKVTQKRIIT